MPSPHPASRPAAWLLSVLCASVLAAPAAAHHSFAATYDGQRHLSLEGVVTRIEWVNPHAYLFVDVTDGTGVTRNWALEIGDLIDLEDSGWSPASVAIGDAVRVQGNPARDLSRRVFAVSVMRSGDGQSLFGRGAPASAATGGSGEPPRDTPRDAEGRVLLGPPPGEKGYWARPSSSALVEDTGEEILMDPSGLLLDLSDIDRVAPLRPWARAVYELRQRDLLASDPYTARCIPPGGPRQFLMPNGLQLIDQRQLGRVLILLGGGNRNWRIVPTDGRELTQPEDAVMSYYGTSVGHWEGDTLVIESVGFNERFWFTNGGLPHTEALRLTERISRPDFETLHYEVTVDDARAYTRPWTGRWTLHWVEGEIREFFCEDNAEWTFNR